MSNPNKIRIIYHPAKKSICFHVYEDEEELHDSFEKLEKYSVDKEGKFVLSLVGRDFFEDIAYIFPTKSSVDCSIKTTKIDYEEFKQKLYDYNTFATQNKKCIINLSELTEEDTLVDMGESFKAIKEQGDSITKLLNKYSLSIKNIKCQSENSKTYLYKIADQIKKESEKISKSLNSLAEDNNVNICLIGVHSSGKSTLINTLVGYKILPVDIRPETAKMLKIIGVDKEDSSYIKFGVNEKECLINWNNQSEKLEIKNSDLDNTLMNEVKECLDNNSNKKLHEQIYCILDYLNKREDLNACIDLGFSIPLDAEDLKFTIYDTPGSDSNIGYHKKILSEALSNQTNSILLFVLLPDSLSGTGNIELMQELLEKSDESDNLIDMEQSFFVFNKADSSGDELEKLTNSKLKKSKDDNDPIDLCDRKLFFVSSKLGYSAVSKKNKISTMNEETYLKYDGPKSLNELAGKYYQHNHCGKSEYATNLMIKEAEAALSNAKNDFEQYIISSGIFTLQKEIKKYGERYASAVKTSAIIKCIESAADSVNNMVNETKFGTDNVVSNKKEQLENEIKKIENIIDCTAQKYNKEIIKSEDLGVDSLSFESCVLNKVEEILDKRLERFLRLFKVHVDKQMQPAVQSDIKEIYLNYTNNYKEKRKKFLVETQKQFVDDFFNKLNEDKNISSEIKEHLKTVKAPDIPEFGLEAYIDELFKNAKLFEHKIIKKMISALAKASNKISDKVHNNQRAEANIVGKATVYTMGKINDGIQIANNKIQKWDTRKIGKKVFISSVKDWCHENQGELTSKLIEEYKNSLNQICEDLKNEFKDNIERYSTRVKALKEDNKSLEELSNEIKEMESQFSQLRKELEKKI